MIPKKTLLLVLLSLWTSAAAARSLHYYAKRGDVGMVETLLQGGAHPDKRHPITKRTPLMVAARNGHSRRHLEVVRRLIGAGANVNTPTFSREDSALSFAFKFSTIPEIARDLLKAGARIDGLITISALATQSLIGWIAEENRFDLVYYIVEAGTDLDTQSLRNGSTLLITATHHGRMDMVAKLLKAGADFDIRAKDGETALSAAIKGNHPSIIRALMDAGAHPDPALSCRKRTEDMVAPIMRTSV